MTPLSPSCITSALACAWVVLAQAPQRDFVRSSTANQYDAGLPWMSRPCRELILSFLNKESVMLEYGGGGSTIFFSQYVGKLYTVENDAAFVSDLNLKLIQHNRTNVKVRHVLPDKSIAVGSVKSLDEPNSPYLKYLQAMKGGDHFDDPDQRYQRGKVHWLAHSPADGSQTGFPWIKNTPSSSGGLRHGWCSKCYTKFKGDWETHGTYLRTIETLETTPVLFNFILCDGQARAACAFVASEWLAPGGIIALHDFYVATSRENFVKKWNPSALLKYFYVVAKLDQRHPYISGGTVVLLQKRIPGHKFKAGGSLPFSENWDNTNGVGL